MKGLNIACWNARGIMPGALYVDHLLNKNDIDILGISEHWLFPHSLNFLGSINVKYDYASVCDNDLCTPHHVVDVMLEEKGVLPYYGTNGYLTASQTSTRETTELSESI